MKAKLLLLALVMLFIVPTVLALDTVYQETPNATSCIGVWNPIYPCSNCYDTDYGTSGRHGASAANLTWNYTKWSNATHEANGSYIRLDDGSVPGDIKYIKVPDTCWNASSEVINFKLELNSASFTWCMNSTGWQYLSNEGYGYFWEESINWTVASKVALTEDTINFSSTLPTTNTQLNVSSVTYNVSVNSSTNFNCTLYINLTANETKLYNNGTNHNVNFSKSMGEATYSWFIGCTNVNETKNTTTSILYIDTTAPNITWTSLDGNATTHSNTMGLEIEVTDNNPYSINIADSCGYTYTNTSITSPYTYNQTISTGNCTGQSQTTNITFCDGFVSALTCQEKVFAWSSKSRLNITAYDFNGNAIQNFTIYLNGTLDGTTTKYYYHLDNINQTTYNVTFAADGYATTNANITVNSTYQLYNFTVYTQNSINITIRDEENESIITDLVTLNLISNIYANNYTTSNGTLYIDLLSPTTYTLRYSAIGFPERFYTLHIYNNTYNPITLYLLRNTSTSTITATVYDEERNVVENVYIKALRYDLASNSYLIREIGKTNFEGESVLNLQLNTEYYKFILEYPLGTIVLETSPDYIRQTSIEFEITIGGGIAENFYKEMDITYGDITFNNETNKFRWTYSDSNNILTQACVKVYKTSLRGQELYNTSCTTAEAATMLTGVVNISGTTYEAKAYAYFGDEEHFLTSTIYTFKEADVGGKQGVFWIIVLMITFAMIGAYSKPLALILTPIPIFLGSILHIIDIPIPMAATIEIICIIVAIIISKRNY